MGLFLDAADLIAFAPGLDEARADAMIGDAEALALLSAPCLTVEDFAYGDAVRAILRGAILRWHEAGTGAYQSQSAGPYAVAYDNRTERRNLFWPSEISTLQKLCSTGGADANGMAFTIDTTPSDVRGAGYWSQPDTWTPYYPGP